MSMFAPVRFFRANTVLGMCRRWLAIPRHTDSFEHCHATPSMYTLSTAPELVDYKRYEAKARGMFGLKASFLSPKDFNYELPSKGVPEFAFVGRSNVGKSTLISALLGDKSGKLVRTSKEPGCTRSVNYFSLAKGKDPTAAQCFLVDLPGYGFAKVSKEDRESWVNMIEGYVFGRDFSVLRRVYVLVDGRLPLKQPDAEMIHDLGKAGVPFQVVVTKADQAKQLEEKTLSDVFQVLSRFSHPNAVPHVHVVSAKKGTGVRDLQNSIMCVVLGDDTEEEAEGEEE